ncbi:methylated-DNA--[protein]-cysteine S-methyltransferase [Methylomagnum sp.]
MIAAPFGGLRLLVEGDELVAMEFESEFTSETVPANPILEMAAYQLARYFKDPRTEFSLPLRLTGTDYTRRVWSALVQIPPGMAETYGALAKKLSSGPRAIAAACRANAFPIIIPCHRVVSATGLGGYSGQIAGPMLDIKHWLLNHEGYRLD